MRKLLEISACLIFVLIALTIIRIKPKRIAFGFYAGECVGNCGTIYEVTEKALRIDTTSFWRTRNDLNKLQIEGQRCLEQKDARHFNSKKFSIPLIMLFEPRTILGSPDGYDQGGYYLDFTLFGIKRHFLVEKDSEPFYFKRLTKSIDQKINEINSELNEGR